MKTIKYILSIFTLSLFFSSCETDGEMISEASTTSFSVKIGWQANSDRVYKATFNDKDIILGDGITVSKDNLSGILKVYNGEEPTPELEETVNFSPRQTIELIQLPDSPIMLASGGSEDDPSNRNSVKVRLFYKDIPDYGNKILIDLYATVDNSTFKPIGETITLEDGKLSEYIELNLNEFYLESPEEVIFKFDIKSLEGEILLSHTASRNNSIQYDQYSAELNDSGWEGYYKSSICQLNKGGRTTRFLFAFGTPWEE